MVPVAVVMGLYFFDMIITLLLSALSEIFPGMDDFGFGKFISKFFSLILILSFGIIFAALPPA
jgi:hypothetical protein